MLDKNDRSKGMKQQSMSVLSIVTKPFRASQPIPVEYRANFRYLYGDIAWFGILSGTSLSFISVYAARIGANAWQIGLLNAGPALVGLLFTLPVGRWLHTRPVGGAVFWSSVWARSGYLVWCLLPALLAPQAQIWSFVILVLLMSVPATVLSVGFNALYASAVPPEWRGHVAGLRNDYSDYQLPSQIGNLAVGRRPGFFENNMLLLRMILSIFATPERHAQGQMSGEADPRLAQIFSENMRLIADIDRHFGVKPIFVPQILNYARFKNAGSSGWIPLVPDKDVKTVMQALNQDLSTVARETGTLFLDKPLSVAWQNSDFVDQGHFSAAGAKKFAEAIAGDVAAHCRP